MTMNRAAFFAAVRAPFGTLKQSQVDGFNALLDCWEARSGGDDRHFAYMLATAWHETNRAMQPIEESLTYTTAERIRAVWPSRFPTAESAKPYVRSPQKLANKVYGGRLGNTGPNDGWTYRGRGLPMLTGKVNYARASTELGLDLVGNPDLALKPEIAAGILFVGMEQGWFTSKKLSDYEGGGLEFDAKNARRIINGLDQADKIASYYHCFLRAVLAAQAEMAPAPEPPVPIPPPPDIPAPVPSAQPATSAGFFNALLSLLKRIFA